jgi:glycosyltransferase involved in cell wall biosynthesis
VKRAEDLKVAWLFPSLERGNYWHPIWSAFCKALPQTVIYTGYWAGYSPGFEDHFRVEVVGEARFFATDKPDTGYYRNFTLLSFGIVKPLLQFRPDVVFTSAFSLWTAIVLLLKLLLGWRVIVIFDGVSPGVDYLNSGSRIYARRAMMPLIDGLITNSQVSKKYLVEDLGAKPERVFVRPYLVPDVAALLKQADSVTLEQNQLHHPIFLYVGQLISRKGVKYLLEACKILRQMSDRPFTLLLVGDGEQYPELETFVQVEGLSEQVKFIGQVEYAKLGYFFTQSDVFIFPTLEDIWGMVVLEAMAFGKPILCSKWATASEMVIEGENGYTFDPFNPAELTETMSYLLAHPDAIKQMGEKSRETVSQHTPAAAAELFQKAISFALKIQESFEPS